MIRLRLTSEYLAGPIFCPDPDRMGRVDIEDSPLSQELMAKSVSGTVSAKRRSTAITLPIVVLPLLRLSFGIKPKGCNW